MKATITGILQRASLVPDERAQVRLDYAHGFVHLEIPELVPLFPEEPVDQIVLRKLQQILSALSEGEQSSEGLSVQAPPE